jgi:DNA-binding transcriptional ArsR family regulator
MPGPATADLDLAFAALSDPTRRAVIRALMKRPRRAGELADAVSISPPALSRHLRVLRRAGLVAEDGIDDDARVRVYRIEAGAFRPMGAWLDRVEAFWQDQLDAFKAHAERAHRSRRRP